VTGVTRNERAHFEKTSSSFTKKTWASRNP
jgi:hypothetical protein